MISNGHNRDVERRQVAIRKYDWFIASCQEVFVNKISSRKAGQDNDTLQTWNVQVPEIHREWSGGGACLLISRNQKPQITRTGHRGTFSLSLPLQWPLYSRWSHSSEGNLFRDYGARNVNRQPECSKSCCLNDKFSCLRQIPTQRKQQRDPDIKDWDQHHL